ncbi:MAG: type II toxin-antitoxin system RelE/ParE family toxin [Candidatus Saliniplasma sp.]
MYDIVYSEKAVEKLEKIESEIRERIVKKLDEIKQFPEHYLKPLSNIDGYSLRVGDYRVLIKLKKEEEEIFVGTLGHRRNIYDREL